MYQKYHAFIRYPRFALKSPIAKAGLRRWKIVDQVRHDSMGQKSTLRLFYHLQYLICKQYFCKE
ncbi:hypothetical protein [Parabacteroides pacaensis]|uniref:hypothetical protein n=1 Tax=Parabacteroides pacaensis TaxID=2086575 RepID=UPI000D105B33|nr:hypothetical protein [Parabacteroides pacaensis]